jgi:queuine tRNA-ribosyltransferase
VEEAGVTFAYAVDGKRTFLSPEVSMQLQQQLGADIAMAFDECLPFGVDKARAEISVERTARWEERCRKAHLRPDQSLFGIVQGAFWPDLRRRSAHQVTGIGFDGYAIGGLSVGEGRDRMCAVLEATVPHLPADRPRYLMGVGHPLDLVEAVARGVDMFDCVIATRHARSGVLYTTRGRLRMTDRRFRGDLYPPDTACPCSTCQTFSRAYLHHLFRVKEVLAATLATVHNLTFFAAHMAAIRAAIAEGRFEAFRAQARETWGQGETAEPLPDQR